MNKKINYKKICNNLLSSLPLQTSDIIKKRFGLDDGKRKTLEAIGQGYGLTRERIRQIINEGFSKIQPKLKKCSEVSKYFNEAFKSFGDLKKEDILLFSLGREKFQNQVFFLLNLESGFNRLPEDKDFYSLFARKNEAVGLAKKIVDLTINKLQTEKKTLSLEKLYEVEKAEIRKVFDRGINKTIFNSYIEISKKIQKNPENQYGLKDWLEINPRGIKDKAYLALKRAGKPLHFAMVANFIEKLPLASQKGAHLATVHNELIKDPRFVLVGRGIYALREWGYEPGVVKDIIFKVLRETNKPLTKGEIIKKVLEQRFVKANTILLNLQDKNNFLKDERGRYQLNIKEA